MHWKLWAIKAGMVMAPPLLRGLATVANRMAQWAEWLVAKYYAEEARIKGQAPGGSAPSCKWPGDCEQRSVMGQCKQAIMPCSYLDAIELQRCTFKGKCDLKSVAYYCTLINQACSWQDGADIDPAKLVLGGQQ